MTSAPPAGFPRLCAITDRVLAGQKSHEAIARELRAGGATWIQLREKHLPAGAFLTEARSALEAVKRGQGAPLVLVNDRVDIALACECDGVHVGRSDLPAAEARRLLGSRAIVGVSTHSLEEGMASALLPVDYVAIGPVFPTATKPDSEPVVGLETVRRLAARIALPVVAIGGITPDNARRVVDSGARSVAVISALYAPGRSIHANVEALLRALG